MSAIFHRAGKTVPPTAVGGEGCYLFDAEGRRYLDASGGAAVSCLGHNDASVIEAIKRQLDALAYAHTGFFTTEPAEQLADHLVQRAPEGIEKVYFVSGGSEAVEAALKLARQYFVDRGEDGRRHFIARRQSYHGNTLGALSVGGNAWRRALYEPLLLDTHHVDPCFAYRYQSEDESDEAYVTRLAGELEAKIQELGADTVIAFIAEPVVGATAGAVPPVGDYFKRMREICDRYGILLILDEVMCGMGRTGTLYACEQDGVAPDIICCAKGLGAGYQPIGAMLLSATIHDTIVNASGAFQHGHTYMGHPTASAAALAVQQRISDDDLTQRVRDKSSFLSEALHGRFGQHPNVGDIRGRGFFLGLELIADRESKEPFDPSLKLNAILRREAMDVGLICYTAGGTIDGRRGDHVLLAPPFIIEDDQIGELVDKLELALDGALRQIAR